MRKQISDYVRRVAAEQDNPDNALFLDELADRIVRIPEPVAKRVTRTVPLLYKGTVTRSVLVCENCDAEVGRKDKYCRNCGKKLFD